MLKKILKITGITFLLLFIMALILPFLFKDKIIAKVKEEANKNLNAKLEFRDLSLGLISSFPNFNIELQGLSLSGINEFKSDTLISAESLAITTDIMSVIGGGEIAIKSIDVDKARIHLKVLKDGKANWDITKPSATPETPSTEPSTFKAKLQEYSLKSSRIWYEDQTMDFTALLDGINHSGSGDFTADVTNLETLTTIDSMDVVYGGIAYLKRANLEYKADFNLDLKNSVYAFKDNELRLNNLLLKFAGSIAMPANDITMDITYEALKNDVKNFISIVPGAFTKDFEQVKSSGKLAFNGFVKGVYNEKSIPGFAFNLLIENGSIQYPSLPRGISNLQVKTSITCPGVDVNKTVIDVSKLHAD
ncbi:MAG TPA: AsmA family protein, partial [Flavobacteriales bacterium]|nr:AsmA family protein [Flavobacteriales bacterium]